MFFENHFINPPKKTRRRLACLRLNGGRKNHFNDNQDLLGYPYILEENAMDVSLPKLVYSHLVLRDE